MAMVVLGGPTAVSVGAIMASDASEKVRYQPVVEVAGAGIDMLVPRALHWRGWRWARSATTGHTTPNTGSAGGPATGCRASVLRAPEPDSERGWLRCFRRESVHSVPCTGGASESGLRPLLPAAVWPGAGYFRRPGLGAGDCVEGSPRRIRTRSSRERKDGRTHLAPQSPSTGSTWRRGPLSPWTVQDAWDGDSETLPERLTMATQQVEAVQPAGAAARRGGRRQGQPRRQDAGRARRDCGSELY